MTIGRAAHRRVSGGGVSLYQVGPDPDAACTEEHVNR
jgi:hypothetical protein